VLQGDREAYAEIVRAHHPRVLSHCLSMLLDKAEADDAAQDVFLKAFSALHTYTRDLSLGAWLYRIASNHCLDVLRKKKRQKTDSLDNLLEQRREHAEDSLPGASDSSEMLSDRADKLKLALQALSLLPWEQRQILVLRELDELSYEQICSFLGCSLDAVKARLRRARQNLQQQARHFLERESFNL
jgi:RNA polymerase sigma-70 factor (ECF subfamily)